MVVVPPYPDEVFVSWYARVRHFIFASGSAVNRLFFGKKILTFRIDFPGNLNAFINAGDQRLSFEQIVERHTLLPFYEKFISSEKRQDILKFMRVGSTGMHIPGGTPKVCPVCAASDLKSLGEVYYHRIHQVPGILICPLHNVFLDDPIFGSEGCSKGQHLFTYPGAAYSPRPFRANKEKILTNLAEMAVNAFEPDSINFYSFDFSKFAIDKGYINLTRQKCLNLLKFHADFQNFVKPISSYFNSSDFNSETLFYNTHKKTQNPFRYLITYSFLEGRKAQKVTGPIKTQEWFGPGPWQCLNRFCDGYHLPLITKIQTRRADHGRFRGTLSCPRCEMTYHIFKAVYSTRIRIEDYGPVYVKHIKKMVRQGLTQNAISVQGNIGRKSLIKLILKHDIPVPWAIKKTTKKRHNPLAYRAERRVKWIKLIKNTTKTKLGSFGWTYQWFMKYDRDWFYKTNVKYWKGAKKR